LLSVTVNVTTGGLAITTSSVDGRHEPAESLDLLFGQRAAIADRDDRCVGGGVAVKHVDYTVAVEILIGKIRNAVLVQVPTGEPVGTIRARRACRPGCSIVAVVAFATCDAESENDDGQERDQPKFSVS
jgi:hypothetical protein